MQPGPNSPSAANTLHCKCGKPMRSVYRRWSVGPKGSTQLRETGQRSSRGAAAVEFALVLPLLLSLVFGIIEFGWAYGQMLDVRHGAREGARLIAVNDFPAGQTAEDLSAAEQSEYLVRTICSRMDLTSDAKVSLSFAVTGGVSAGQTAIIVVESDLDTATGWFDPLLGSKTLQSDLQVRIEQEATWAEVTEVTCSSVATP
jgi:hypothetical protein